jgi:aryl-alcohol dehydrogenase-like predicted oxidoreductase
METRRLGEGGPEISVVGYGAWEAGGADWGADVGSDRIKDSIRGALDSGMSWVDTAEAYGNGRSEELIGEVLAERNRDDVLVFTKWAYFGSGSRPEDGHKAIRGSLQRLGVDHVDLYQVHWPVPGVPVEDIWGTMAEIQDQGLARHIGVSNFERELVERCLSIRHVDSVQNQFSLLARWDADELVPWLAEKGVGYLGYGPLAFGLLTGAITRETKFDRSDWRSGSQDMGYYDLFFAPGKLEANLDRVDRLREIAERIGAPLASLSLRAALDIAPTTAMIAGSTNPDHVRSNAEAGDLRLDDATLNEVREAIA